MPSQHKKKKIREIRLDLGHFPTFAEYVAYQEDTYDEPQGREEDFVRQGLTIKGPKGGKVRQPRMERRKPAATDNQTRALRALRVGDWKDEAFDPADNPNYMANTGMNAGYMPSDRPQKMAQLQQALQTYGIHDPQFKALASKLFDRYSVDDAIQQIMQDPRNASIVNQPAGENDWKWYRGQQGHCTNCGKPSQNDDGNGENFCSQQCQLAHWDQQNGDQQQPQQQPEDDIFAGLDQQQPQQRQPMQQPQQRPADEDNIFAGL